MSGIIMNGTTGGTAIGCLAGIIAPSTMTRSGTSFSVPILATGGRCTSVVVPRSNIRGVAVAVNKGSFVCSGNAPFGFRDNGVAAVGLRMKHSIVGLNGIGVSS